MDDLVPQTERCAECGGPLVDGKDCREQLASILGWESSDPELFTLHFYTVASFNLQHPAQFTDGALQELRSAFVEALDATTPIETLSRKMGAKFQGSKRVLRSAGNRHPVLKDWQVTGADVFASGLPDGAAYRVRRWASSVRTPL
jgi:hypothetical protein